MPGVLARLMQPQATWSAPGALDEWSEWYSHPAMSWLSQAGIRITPQAAMMVSTVWSCVRVIAETLASVPLDVYERQSDEARRRAAELVLFTLLHDTPNEHQTSFTWREMLTGHACLRGNGLSEIVPDDRGLVRELLPIHPDRVRIDVDEEGAIRYWVRNRDGTEPRRPLLEDEVFHLRGLNDNGITGMSVVEMARDSIGLARAAETHGSRTFANGPKLAGVLQHPTRLTPEAAKHIRESWKQTYGTINSAGETAVLWEGMTWQGIGMSNEDAQYLATREFQVAEIARWFRVPLHMINETTKSTSWGTGIEQMTIGFVIYTMLPWARRWEQQIAKSLIVAPQRFYAEFNFDGLLRGDMKTRNEAFALAVQWGWMTRNEVRRLLNMNRIDGLDEPLTPLNMAVGDQPLVAPSKAADAMARGEGVKALAPPETAEGHELLGLLAQEAAERLVQKERDRVSKAAAKFAGDVEAWSGWLGEFYEKHASDVARTLHIPERAAQAYAGEQKAAIERDGVSVCETWGTWRADQLVGLMLDSERGSAPPRPRKVRKSGTIGGRAIDLVEEEIS